MIWYITGQTLFSEEKIAQTANDGDQVMIAFKWQDDAKQESWGRKENLASSSG